MIKRFRLSILLRCIFCLACVTFVTSPILISFYPTVLEAATKKQTKKKSKKKSRSKKISLAPQTQDPKYAAVVVDANAGAIIYEKNAESIRHPASLTKMMTLYLLFDAMERGKVSPSTRMDVSAKAAGQPPTNINLSGGERLEVRTAIPALIIRSANDVAMVVAEHLGGSQAGFAAMMNKKARELGMTQTKFYNPSGLPDDRQVTSAVDMAKLAIALKRDFPEYYHHFKKQSFSYNGVTYKTHNRVVGRYPGADGLKTGYIRASGFNLVTSVTRGKERLIGVVMGGRTAASRDQEMMNMLDKTFFRIGKGRPLEPQDEVMVASAKPEVVTDTLAPAAGEPQILDRATREEKLPTLPPAQMPAFAEGLPIGHNWAVQVGAFPTEKQAETAANNARKLVPALLKDTQLAVSMVVKDGQVYNRSRLMYLSAENARRTCDILSRHRKQCMVIRVE